MRLSVALGCLLLAGCAGPHSTSALWAQRDIEQETVLFQLSDAQRSERLRNFELGLVDETLSAERARVSAGVSVCPGSERVPLAPSVGDRLRDTVRIHAQDDPGRMNNLAQVAVGDWYLRRARGTGDSHFCDAAAAALSGQLAAGSAGPLSDVLGALASATVSRDPAHAQPAGTVDAGSVRLALSNYALGYVDTVRAAPPLPQYLAAVYGGVVLEAAEAAAAPVLNGATPESQVDRFAAAYPDWEPDALYAVLVAK